MTEVIEPLVKDFDVIDGERCSYMSQLLEEDYEDTIFHHVYSRFNGLEVIAANQLYQEIVIKLFDRVFPSGSFQNLNHIVHNTPSVHFTELTQHQRRLSIVVIYKNHSGRFKFIFDMISRWLVPGKNLHISSTFNVDFRISSFSSDIYSLFETVIEAETEEQLREIKRNLPIMDSEIKLGLNSDYFANRIMEIKGLSSDQKTALIQEQIVNLIQRQSKNLDHNVFIEMQHLLVICDDSFKNAREVRHLTRIITFQYLFRKEIRRQLTLKPEDRFVCLKLFRSKIFYEGEKKNVLSIVIGLNFIRDKETFDEKQIIKAVLNHIPFIKPVEKSFFENKQGSEKIYTVYLEIEKNEGTPFTHDEIQLLRKRLPDDLKEKVEHMMHPVFNPRNEEEIMRNILSLSHQIKFIRDIPQVFISFDEQTLIHVYFTVILVRILKPDSEQIQKMFREKKCSLEYLHDRCKKVGSIRKKYVKEANVFRVRLPKDQFLRKDNSIDLYKARQKVVTELYKIVGEFRDFNGGMISKQNELLESVKELLDESVMYNELLFENFFYSLTPVIMRSVLDPNALKNLFLMLLEALEEEFFNEVNNGLHIKSDMHFLYIITQPKSIEFEQDIQEKIDQLKLPSTCVAFSRIKVYDSIFVAYILKSDEISQKNLFKDIIVNTIR